MKIKQSLKLINWKLYFALLVMGLCPTIYTTIRTFFLGHLPNEWSFSIAGQLTWVNLLYEIIDEAIILPLFYFVGRVKDDKQEFTNRIKTGLIITLSIYLTFSLFIIIFAKPLLLAMAADGSILNESVEYIRIEAIANIFKILFSFVCVTLISIGKDKLVYSLTFAKLILCLTCDSLLISTLPFSLNLGINGIGYSNIIVNALLLVVVLMLLNEQGYKILNNKKISFEWTKEFFKVGSISGLESFVRNIAYILMVSRMVNMVAEQGTYWVANNFIWGWLLLPINQLGELIKQEVSTNDKAIQNNTLGYFAITIITCLIWIITIPLYKPFMKYVLAYSDVDKLFNLVMTLLVFYILYAIQNVFDMTFYGKGLTQYMLFESIVTNSVYYGIFFVLYLKGIWIPSLNSIALMFGFGNAFDSIVSAIAYRHMLKKNNINIVKAN